MIKKLSEITEIYLGQPIRDKIDNEPKGDYFIAQMKDVDKESGIDKKSLYRTNLKGRTEPRLVRKGDLLFVSRVFRGSLPYSVYVNIDLPKFVAAPTFHILSVKKEIVRAEYLHWFINSEAHGGKFFRVNAMGSSVLNIPRSVLNDMEVIVPSLQEQDRFVKLIQAVKQEEEIMASLVLKRKLYMSEAINQFFK